MKNQYLVGVKKKEFIRLYDGRVIVGCSLTLKEARETKKFLTNKDIKIYKLVEVK